MKHNGARILDITPAQYHADPCATPSLSASIAHTLVSQSPAHAYEQHPRLGGARDGPGTKALNDGTLIHKLLLGAGPTVVIIGANDYRTNAAKEAREAALEVGALPVLAHVYAEQKAVAEILREKCAALGFLFKGRSELAIEWTDTGAQGPVLCRSMLDHVYVDRGVIYDVKTARSANPRDCERHFVEYGYDISYAAYTRALAALEPEFAGRVDMVFLYMELEPPYAVVPARLGGALREIGAMRWARALTLWEECLTSQHWPGYCNGTPVTLEAPQWEIARELAGESVP